MQGARVGLSLNEILAMRSLSAKTISGRRRPDSSRGATGPRTGACPPCTRCAATSRDTTDLHDTECLPASSTPQVPGTDRSALTRVYFDGRRHIAVRGTCGAKPSVAPKSRLGQERAVATAAIGGHTCAQPFATARLRAVAEPRLQCSIASMASTTWRTASFSLSVRWGFQQSINRIKRGWSERFQASCS